LLPLVYEELRKLAASKMAHEAPGHTLQPTALVHEAWLRLVGNANQQWNGSAHFFGAAAEAMRRILIEKARRRSAQRHGGGLERVDISMLDVPAANGDEQLFAVNEALDKLAAQNPEKAELVKLRYFVGMTIAEAAEALGLSEPAARRQWAFARAWLFREIKQKVI
jgi:RNA polymerase sigma factor (TIGR02999 family)